MWKYNGLGLGAAVFVHEHMTQITNSVSCKHIFIQEHQQHLCTTCEY